MRRILFFEDFPFASENRLLRLRLRRHLHGIEIQIFEEKTVRGFEERLSRQRFDVLILDIMAQAPGDFTWSDTGDPVPSSLTGVELLRRCRNGKYGDHYQTVPIYMRTARGEAHIRRLCFQEGATDYFKAGGDDKALMEAIKKQLDADR